MNATAFRTSPRVLPALESPRFRYKRLAVGVGLALGSLLVCGAAAAAPPGVANTTSPTGGKVTGGVGAITQQGVETIVHQQSKLLSLDWQTFNVGKDASVLFKQPGSSAVALNRILDQNPSQIFGKISSNGQVFLINTHGIIFGASAQLNVGGLVASTLDLTPSDFLKQHFDLDAHGGHAGVVNHGTIAAARGGSVSLIGGHVENDGLIVADYGHINLDGADKAVLNFDGDGLINVEITGALKQRFDADQAVVANKGTLHAQSGSVVLQASAAKNLFTNLVNNSGLIKAGGIDTAGGVVRLVGNGGNTVNSGDIDVSGEHGGSAQLLSDQNVGVTDGSINASGVDGGGSIRVGGGWQGGEGLPTTQVSYVAPDAVLDASAIRRGDGGSVVVWGNRGNNFFGRINARGGSLAGNGGSVETSSHAGLNVQGYVDAAAPHGVAGTWLLDPSNVEITDTGGTLSGTAPDVYYSPVAEDSQISASMIGTALTGGTNVSVYTGSSGSQPGDITVSEPIAASGAGSLYLMAAGSIFLDKSIQGTAGKLNVRLWANYGGLTPVGPTYVYKSNAGCPGCDVVVGDIGNASIVTLGGNVDIRTGDATHAGGSVTLGSASATGSIDTTNGANPAGDVAIAATGVAEAAGSGNYIHTAALTVDAGVGAIDLDSSGNDLTGAVELTNSGSGDVALGNGGNALLLGDVQVGTGALSVSGKGITQAATTSITQAPGAGAATFDAGAGVLTLGNSGNDFTGAVSLNNSGANAVSLDNGGNALTLGAVGVGSGGLSLTDLGAGALTLTGNITTGGSAVAFGNAVILGAPLITIVTTGGGAAGANVGFADKLDGETVGSNALTVDAGSGSVGFAAAVGSGTPLKALALSGGSYAEFGSTVEATSLASAIATRLSQDVTTNGVQTYNGALSLFNSVTLKSGGDNITFADISNQDGSPATLTVNAGAGTVAFNGGVCASGCTTALGLDVTATGGISEGGSGQIHAGLAAGFNAGTAAITLTNGNNDFQGAVSLAGGIVKLTTSGALRLDTVNVASLGVKAAGAITQSGGATVSGTSSFDAGANAIALDNAGNHFTGAVGLTNSGANNVALDDGSHALILGNVNVGSGTLTVNGAGISQAAGTKVTQAPGAGAATFDAGSSDALALGNPNNVLTGAVAATGAGISVATQGNLVIASLADTADNDLSLVAGGALSGVTAFDAGAGDVTLAANGGTLATTGLVKGGDVALTGRDGISLGGDVEASGTLGLTSTNAPILQTAGTITATGITTVVAGAGGITLADANAFNNTVNLTGATTTINNSGALTLGALNTGALLATSHGVLNLGQGTITGGLQASSDNHDIKQAAGGLTVTGVTVLTAGGGAITLADNNNDFQGSVQADGTGVSVTDKNNLQIAGLTNHGGAVSLIAGGTLSGFGPINAGAGTITLTANGGALAPGALKGSDITLTAGAGDITLAGDVTATGTVSLTSGGNIAQNATTVIAADTLTGSSTGATTLGNANNIATLSDFTAAGFSLSDARTLTVAAGHAVDGGGSTTLATTGAGHDLVVNGTVQGTATNLVSSGAIAEDNAAAVVAGTLTGSAAGDATLTGANQVNTLGSFSADNFSMVNHKALTVVGPLTTGGDINLKTVGTGNVLSVGQALTGGVVTLDSAGNLSVVNAVQGSTVNLSANGDLAIDATVKSGSGTTTLIQNGSSGAISEGSGGAITAGTLAGTAQGSVVLDQANHVTNLGDFTAGNGFSLANAQALTVVDGSTLDGGTSVSLTTTGSGSDLTINGTVKGTTTQLVSAGAIAEGSHGSIVAGTLSGSAAHAAQLTGTNAIAKLGNFSAESFNLSDAAALTIVNGATVDGGTTTTLTTTGAAGNLAIDGTLKGATTSLFVSGSITEGADGVVQAGTLSGSSVGSAILDGDNQIANLGNFIANGFALTSGSGLTVVAGNTVDGGGSTALATTGSGHDIQLNGVVNGDTTTLISGGGIAEGAAGRISADTLTGEAAGAVALTGANHVASLGAFTAGNFQLADAHALAVGGPLKTTGGTGDISLTTTGGTGNTLTVNQAIQGGGITLASAGDLTVANAITGNKVDLASHGDLAINAAVDAGAGMVTLTQQGAGAIDSDANGSIAAGTLTGSATGATVLGSATQFQANRVGVLGGFSSPAGFSFTNEGTLTLASVGGSAFTVDAGKSDTYLAVRGGDLLQQGTNWLYNDTGAWSSTGHIGLAAAPIYVMGVGTQTVATIGLPPAYFYAVDSNGGLLPVVGSDSVNVPASIAAGHSQGINGHTDHYIDVSVITAIYRGYGVVAPGVLLPPDQRECSPDQSASGSCQKDP